MNTHYCNISWYQHRDNYGCGIILCSRNVTVNELSKVLKEIISEGGYGIKVEVFKGRMDK